MNRAAPLNALELMEHEMQRARPLAPEAIFSPAAARGALPRLAAAAAGPAQPLPAAPAPGSLKCPLILVMDGYALDPKLTVGAKPK